MPASTLASSSPRLRAFSTNDTVSGVLAGVVPNTLADLSAAVPMPCGTATFAFGWVAPVAGPAASSCRDPAAPMASSALPRRCVTRAMSFNGLLLGCLDSSGSP
jgi:hypothetical protein